MGGRKKIIALAKHKAAGPKRKQITKKNANQASNPIQVPGTLRNSVNTKNNRARAKRSLHTAFGAATTDVLHQPEIAVNSPNPDEPIHSPEQHDAACAETGTESDTLKGNKACSGVKRSCSHPQPSKSALPAAQI